MIEENKQEDITKYSKEAFSFVDDDPKKSIQTLCKLKAVGPATASGKSFWFEIWYKNDNVLSKTTQKFKTYNIEGKEDVFLWICISAYIKSHFNIDMTLTKPTFIVSDTWFYWIFSSILLLLSLHKPLVF